MIGASLTGYRIYQQYWLKTGTSYQTGFDRILIHRKPIENLTSERYIDFSVPLNVEKMGATGVRTLAFEEK